MEVHVLFVPVVLKPVTRSILKHEWDILVLRGIYDMSLNIDVKNIMQIITYLLDKLRNSVSKIIGFEQQ